MNVYVYGGTSKDSATISIIENNAPVIVGQTYSIDSELGMILVAYPNED